MLEWMKILLLHFIPLGEVFLTFCNVQVAEVSKSLEFRQSKSVILGLSRHIQFIRFNVHLTLLTTDSLQESDFGLVSD